MPERKPLNMLFPVFPKVFNMLQLFSFFNPKSAIQNPKSCLNGLFVQALSGGLKEKITEFPEATFKAIGRSRFTDLSAMFDEI